MDLINVKGNTYYLDGPQLVGLYKIDEKHCLLFDPGSGKLRDPIEDVLEAVGLTPVGILCTHMHYDHHENSRYFKEKYGAQVCLPQLEADIVRCEQSLKNHLFNFTMGNIRTTPRLQHLICPVDRPVALGETEINFCGVPLTVVRTPGHAPDHCCFVTPDNVCFAGDVLMTPDILKDSMVPFVFDMTDDLDSKEKMKALHYDAYILSHKGVVWGNIAGLAQENILRVRQQLDACAALVTGPMTYSDFYGAIVQAMDLPVGHPIRAQHLERYIRPYVEYLIDRGDLTLIDINGAPAVAPEGLPMDKSVVLGLSGGVDSAVAASLLKDQGYTVYGHWLDIGLGGREDAEAVAERLGIAFSTGDIRRELDAAVMEPFRREYLCGQTPLPCALCNPAVKFPALFQRAEEVGAQYVATGHYARILPDEAGNLGLYRGRAENDQAYMLARLPLAWLPRILFPLGKFRKVGVRALARSFGLPVAEKPDSMEICFIPDGDYAAWLEARGETPPPGVFVDRDGNVLGPHKGIHHYTIGQRRGLDIPAAHRLYVSEIRVEDNTVVLSDGTDLMASEVWGVDWNPLAPVEEGQQVTVRLRHSKTETPARVYPTKEGIRLTLDTPARAPTPGQLAACYHGDQVLGSFWITGAQRD